MGIADLIALQCLAGEEIKKDFIDVEAKGNSQEG
jgi:hypothetical protein